MVSNPKRLRYVSENEFSSSDGEGFEDSTYAQGAKKNDIKSKRGKWLSKNAIMARENRLRKKLYISNLEKEVGCLKSSNEKFSKVIENQSVLINDLRKEIKYLKSVIANSSDIGNLMRNIRQNTGMSVSTSLDQTLSLNDCVSKPKQPISRKTAHPWDENCYPSFPTPESDLLSTSPQSTSGLNDLDDDLLLNLQSDEFLGITDLNPLGLDEVIESRNREHLKEHNYTSVDEDIDVGVCLHVSKHRVSLEFCSTCSDNAANNWD